MLQETVSFEGYKCLSLRIKGSDEWDMSQPTVYISGGVNYSFPMALDESASTVEYAGCMVMPQGDYSGCWLRVPDLDGHVASVDFSVELKENDVAETMDFSAYRAVDFTVNQEELLGRGWVSVFKEGQEIEDEDGVNGDRLLPPGKYPTIGKMHKCTIFRWTK